MRLCPAPLPSTLPSFLLGPRCAPCSAVQARPHLPAPHAFPPPAPALQLFKHFTDVSQGVRRLGSAAIDMCHVASGAWLEWGQCRVGGWVGP